MFYILRNTIHSAQSNPPRMCNPFFLYIIIYTPFVTPKTVLRDKFYEEEAQWLYHFVLLHHRHRHNYHHHHSVMRVEFLITNNIILDHNVLNRIGSDRIIIITQRLLINIVISPKGLNMRSFV